jgi:hypothetical protein
MTDDKDRRERILHEILYNWDGYDVSLSPRENLIELIIELGYRDDAFILLQRYRRKRYK